MVPFLRTERRAYRMPHGASAFPLSAEGDCGSAMTRKVLLRPASSTGHVSTTNPSTAGPGLSHGARPGSAVLVGVANLHSLVVHPPRTSDESQEDGTGTTGCTLT
jgi:hypothetical protein